MTKYEAVARNPYWKLKPEYKNTGLPDTVSFFGSLPSNLDAYEKKYKSSIKVTDGSGKVTYQNMFAGKIIESPEEAVEVAAKLNRKAAEAETARLNRLAVAS